LNAFPDLSGNALPFLAFIVQRAYCRGRAVEHRNGITAVFTVAIHIGHHWTKQSVGLRANLVGGPVIDPQGSRAAPDIHTQRLPGKRLLENTLPEIAGEEQRVRPAGGQSGEES